ncbi:MAG: 7-carboxy-7-deazaguanine synthase QueE [Candidatus Eisenbacteria bacterium]|uniref:7-carboxy-7-deazaguanine synthase n=1 Tax=Eiseniibacteriota bacterium TaxID=2212470 RepID=A0A849SQM9_UNCEI|nr:7-carboxy-7-deazaguanine synthase QueE [Candidatus Eisenbacteria bacterium]
MSTQFRISELFHSLQGEGPLAGTPAHFLRLQGCTVGCQWCDTRYSWSPEGGEPQPIEALFERALALGPADLLVVTGGEPLEHAGLSELLNGALERWTTVEVETSGIAPPPRSHARLRWNVSSKLPSATARWEDTWRHSAAWLAESNATFKLVVGGGDDIADALRMIEAHHLPAHRVMLMPQGMRDAELRERAVELAEICKRHGFRLSARLHVWLWGAKRGV